MFILDEQQPLTLAELLKSYNTSANINIFQRHPLRNKTASVSNIESCLSESFDQRDIYMAWNPLKYKSSTRCKKNVKNLAFLYCDLDICHFDNPFVENEKKYKQDVISALETYVFDKVIPAPTYIVDSGRGLYLMYRIFQNQKLSKNEHINAQKRWARINIHLTKALKDYASDTSVATDESRLLRVPNSVNTKSNTKVKYYLYSNKTYTLHWIEHNYLNTPSDAQIAKMRRVEDTLDITCPVRNKRSIQRFLMRHEREYKKTLLKKPVSDKQLAFCNSIAKVLRIDCPKFRKNSSASRFIKIHIKDYLDVVLKRKFSEHSHDRTSRFLKKRLAVLEKILISARKDSYREIGLFYYRLFALQLTKDTDLSKEMMLDVLSRMDNPLDEKSVLNSTKTAEAYFQSESIYKMKDSTLADKFGLSLDDWHVLKKSCTIERRKIDKNLKSAINRRYYLNKLKKIGKLPKNQVIFKRRNAIAEMLNSGLSKDTICSLLHISLRTFYYDKEKLSESTTTCTPPDEVNDTSITCCAKKSDPQYNKEPLGSSFFTCYALNAIYTQSLSSLTSLWRYIQSRIEACMDDFLCSEHELRDISDLFYRQTLSCPHDFISGFTISA